MLRPSFYSIFSLSFYGGFPRALFYSTAQRERAREAASAVLDELKFLIEYARVFYAW